MAITVGSLPILVDERVLTPDAWQDPIAQGEFAAWSKRLTDWGIETSPAEFEQGAWNAASGILQVQRSLTRPFQPYYEFAGTRQRWRMFPAAVEEPVRLRVDVRIAETWRTVYLMGSPDQRWLARYFDRDRFRAALNLYAWGIHPKSYTEFVDWLRHEVRRDFPEATQLKVGFEIVPALPPGTSIKPRPLPFDQAKQLRVLPL